ncbi:MAG: hypothetical protein V3V14_12935 [Saprospiraceae bacterium]
MKYKLRFLMLFALMLTFLTSEAHKGPQRDKVKSDFASNRAACQQAQAQIDLEINNVRARLLTGGDLWWDLADGKYIVPKPATPEALEVSAIYAGGVWIGGVDPNGNIKLAGVQYANNGNTDWYPGPLIDGAIESEECENWDRFFTVKGSEVRSFVAAYNNNPTDFPCDSIADNIKYWPGKGNPYFPEKFDFQIPNQHLAPFWDEDGDDEYNPCNGDFPIIEIRDCEPEDKAGALDLLPDEMIFWVYNDAGGAHKLTLGTKIQMEVQVQAFAYATNDELNDMTFYRYKLLNQATDYINNCYFAMWVDPDLGCFEDDYIGCDEERSMAYIYNEDAVDGNPGTSCNGVNTYGTDIPMVGIDYFRGPRRPVLFCRDENDNIIYNDDGSKKLCEVPLGTLEQDSLVELGMTSFIYNNNCGVGTPADATCDPDRDSEFYNVIRGLWKDGTPLTFGGSGYNPGSQDSVKYAFTGEPNIDSDWTMCSADLDYGDRRTVQATGPLLLLPGATNELIIGVVFVPNVVHDCPNISRLQDADDVAQALFNNCFNILDGPDAPDLSAIELDQQLVLMLSNDSLRDESNNYKELYQEVDPVAEQKDGNFDSLYLFEGYKIFQLANANVTAQQFDDVEYSRLIRQVDLKNETTEIFNWKKINNPDINDQRDLFVPVRKVNGENNGIRHSFNITRDQFATGDKRLINHKNYYFSVIAYGQNNFKRFDPLLHPDSIQGQPNGYIEGRNNIRTYTLTPRPIVFEDLQSAYGQEAKVTRISGVGTGFNGLDLADGVKESIMDGTFNGEIEYKPGNAPINAKILDPLRIKNGEYRLEIVGEFNDSQNGLNLEDDARWVLTSIPDGKVIASEKTIEEINEQIIYGEGFSISVNQVGEPGELFTEENGGIAQRYAYDDPSKSNWWKGIPASTGVTVVIDEAEDRSANLFQFVEFESEEDPKGALTSIDDEFFIPIHQARWRGSDDSYFTPAWKESQGFAITQKKLRLKDLNNVDIVFTSDKTKWSECIVIESAVPDYQAAGAATEGDAINWDLREHTSIDTEGNEIEGSGKSYFPGYAIDVETGERLNIFFGENSVFNEEINTAFHDAFPNLETDLSIGADMIWNPGTELFASGTVFNNSPLNSYVGAQHYIYVTRQKYDRCDALHEILSQNGILNKIDAVSMVTWTAFPNLEKPLLPLSEGLIPNDLVVKLRVTNPFNKETQLKNNKKPLGFDVVGDLPVYNFAFENVESRELDPNEHSNALDNVRVVPNPYYAYSTYEHNQFTNIIKVTNLPARAIVTIYSLDGKFIQQFNRDAIPSVNGGSNPAISETQTLPNLEWNLKNSKGIPVASGVYIFHISAPGLGVEKSIKWFGINRKFDPTGL